MISIINDIITTLQDFQFSMPNVSVREIYSVGKIELPLITIDELPSNEGVYLDNQPYIIQNMYTVEVYASQMIIGSVATKKRDVAMLLMQDVDSVLNSIYGLTLVGAVSVAPYENNNIIRVVARYYGYIDSRNNKIYRNL